MTVEFTEEARPTRRYLGRWPRNPPKDPTRVIVHNHVIPPNDPRRGEQDRCKILGTHGFRAWTQESAERGGCPSPGDPPIVPCVCGCFGELKHYCVDLKAAQRARAFPNR